MSMFSVSLPRGPLLASALITLLIDGEILIEDPWNRIRGEHAGAVMKDLGSEDRVLMVFLTKKGLA
jgi:hypothetical protein